MTTRQTVSIPNPLRRRLLLALPGGLAFMTPLALIGCGSGDDPDATPAATGSLREPGRAFVGTQTYTSTLVSVEVPTGVALPDGGLAAYTPLGGFGPVADGQATVRHLFGTPQWTTLLTAEGQPLLFGFVGAGMTTLSAHSTATALLAFAMGAEWAGGTTNGAWIEELHASPATAAFAQAIADALVADPYALAEGHQSIIDAAADAVRALLPAALAASQRARPLGLTIDPPNAESGVQPIIGASVNTAYVQNEKLRRAFHVVRREGYIDASGTEVPDTARPVIVSGDIPMLPGFDSAGSIIGSVAQAHYAQDSSGLAFSRTADAALPLAPDGARRTKYSVMVLMAGNAALSYDPDAYAKLDDNERRMIDITLFAPENLALRQLFIDLLVPLFLSWLGGKIGDEASGFGPREYKQKLETALFGSLLGVFQSTLPTIAAKIRDPKTYPDYGVGGALIDIVRSHLIDLVDVPVPGRPKPLTVPVLSQFSIGILLLLLKYLAYEKMNVANGEALLNFLEGDANKDGETPLEWQPAGTDKNGKPKQPWKFTKENLQFAGMGVATKVLGLVNNSLGLLAKSRMLVDMATSRLLERWEVSANGAKVKLTPDLLDLSTGFGVKGTLTASIVDNDDDDYGKELGPITYDWTCTGRWGTLYSVSNTGGPNKFTSSKDNPDADYFPSGAEPDPAKPDEITVTAFFGGVNDAKRTRIGSATAPVRFKREFSLSVLPASGQEVPASDQIGVLATIKETLPKGTTVEWQWSHAGVGSVAAIAPDSNPSDSSVTFDAGSSEGVAVVTVKATVNVPGQDGSPPRSVPTEPISTTLKVKKGLKTLMLSGGWTIEITVPAAGFSQATAWVVVPKVAGAKSYAVSLTKPTPDPAGGVPFPSSRSISPTSLGYWEDRGGSYWSGLSGGGGADPWATTNVVPWLTSRFSDMVVTVTVTL